MWRLESPLLRPPSSPSESRNALHLASASSSPLTALKFLLAVHVYVSKNGNRCHPFSGLAR